MDICNRCMKGFKRMREGRTDEDSGDYEEYCGDCSLIKDIEEGIVAL
ncbi:MAG: hypothetical protein Q8N63_07505 [Nanoarchaeota archaeon]|nr:hypothetical protein [Nanoarchaeota archaeon]